MGRAIAITPTGTGSGTFNVNYDTINTPDEAHEDTVGRPPKPEPCARRRLLARGTGER